MYQEASDLLTRGLSGEDIYVAPKSVKVYNSLSNMLREQAGDGERALLYARKTVKLEPDWENGHHSMANALVLLGKLEKAKIAFEKALQLNPEFAVAHSNFGDCLQKLGSFDDAERSYRESLRFDHTHVLTKFRLASLITKTSHTTPSRLWEAQQL
jgi:Flp pilus assembly protein TadD